MMTDDSRSQLGDAVSAALAGSGDAGSLDFLMDVPLMVTVELGRRRMPIGEILDLVKGSVIELGKVAGEPLDVRVNDRLVARGEAVVVNEKFGVRVTEIVRKERRGAG